MRLRAALAIAASTAGLGAARADAATVSAQKGALSVTAATGERNDLKAAQLTDGLIHIAERGASLLVLAAAPSCRALGGAEVACAPDAINRLDISTGDLDDRVDVDGMIVVPAGIRLGAGNDLALAREGLADSIQGE